MTRNCDKYRACWLVLLLLAAGGTLAAQHGVDGAEPQFSAGGEPVALRVECQSPLVLFQVAEPRAVSLRLMIQDAEGHILFDSGEQPGTETEWDARQWLAKPPAAAWTYELRAWNEAGRLVVRQSGEIRRDPEQPEQINAITAYDSPGNYTIGGYLGVGTSTPERAIHIKGSNAVFRMDRSQDTAAFMIVRNDPAGNILKTFVVGVNASGPNNGSFVINDLGASISGGGTNRLTIDNTGTAIFGGTVRAAGFVTLSARQFKTNIRPLKEAMDLVRQLQGVTFDWRESGEHSLGLIAEDVALVMPELAVPGPDGQPLGIDYSRVAALLVEGMKEQQARIDQAEEDCRRLEERLTRALQKNR